MMRNKEVKKVKEIASFLIEHHIDFKYNAWVTAGRSKNGEIIVDKEIQHSIIIEGDVPAELWPDLADMGFEHHRGKFVAFLYEPLPKDYKDPYDEEETVKFS